MSRGTASPTLPQPFELTLLDSRFGLLRDRPELARALDVPPVGVRRQGFCEAWGLQISAPDQRRSLSLEFSLTQNRNGFRQVAEVTAVGVDRRPDSAPRLALRQSQGIEVWRSGSLPDFAVRIDGCELALERGSTGNELAGTTRGQLLGKGRSLSWDLRLESSAPPLDPDPAARSVRWGLFQMRAHVALPSVRISGTTRIDGETQDWDGASALLCHDYGARVGPGWSRFVGAGFRNEQGEALPMRIIGLARPLAPWGVRLPWPRTLTSMTLEGLPGSAGPLRFEGLLDSLRMDSRPSAQGWSLRLERGEWSVRLEVRSEFRDLVALTSEDTDGHPLFISRAPLATAEVQVFRRGKRELLAISRDASFFEHVSRERNPYLTALI